MSPLGSDDEKEPAMQRAKRRRIRGERRQHSLRDWVEKNKQKQPDKLKELKVN